MKHGWVHNHPPSAGSGMLPGEASLNPAIPPTASMVVSVDSQLGLASQDFSLYFEPPGGILLKRDCPVEQDYEHLLCLSFASTECWMMVAMIYLEKLFLSSLDVFISQIEEVNVTI